MWKDIPNYEGIYQASNYGRIRSCEGKTTINANGLERVWKQRILKFKSGKNCGRGGNKDGDYRVSLWKDGKHRDYLVARLIAMTWVEGYEDGLTVNHIDGDYRNNVSSNLEWVSMGDNIRAGFRTGLYKKNCKRIALTDSAGKHICFPSQLSAGRFLGRSSGYIATMIAKGYTNATSASGEKYTIKAA